MPDKLIKKYADVPMDFADACLVDLATRLQTSRILTLDADFRLYRWGKNRPFDMLLEISSVSWLERRTSSVAWEARRIVPSGGGKV